MRVVCVVFLLILLGAVAVFAVQNNESVTVNYLDRSIALSLPMLVGATYLLGMISGWTVVALLKRSLHRVTQEPPR